ncbi:hypothetical protein Ancab_032554 [Ancistrocladus abbreviatus]
MPTDLILSLMRLILKFIVMRLFALVLCVIRNLSISRLKHGLRREKKFIWGNGKQQTSRYCILSNCLLSSLLFTWYCKGLITVSCVEDMNEWLGIFNVKLQHMREDI